MRSISNSILNKLNSRVQAGANKLSASLWVGRPTTPLTEDRFLEKQNVFSSSNITAVDISVCHPQVMLGATYVYIAYVESGIAKVKRAKYREDMADHIWEDVDFQEEAIDVSICFDGTMPKSISGYVEFVTETEPWIFWVNNVGALYGKKLGQSESILLAETNCSKVSSTRAMWSSVGAFDFGLVIFFLLNGKIYYRQLINEEWFDAEIISFGPDANYSDIAAFRTWDYRIGIQAKTIDNKFYELFTQFMGVGKQNAEHLEVENIEAASNLIEIQDINSKETEHIEISEVYASAPYGGLYSTSIPKLTSARNIADENGDWGTAAEIEFDNYLIASDVENNYMNFSLIDSRNVNYTATKATLKEDGRTIILSFLNFNNAYDKCRIQYTPGNIYSLATVLVESTSFEFIPQNLVPTDIPKPEVESIWNE